MTVQSISAVTLAVRDMAQAVDFYQNKVELDLLYGGGEASFTSFRVGEGYLNLILASDGGWTWWGRLIFYVDDVDALYRKLVAAGLTPDTTPRDAPWRGALLPRHRPGRARVEFCAAVGYWGGLSLGSGRSPLNAAAPTQPIDEGLNCSGILYGFCQERLDESQAFGELTIQPNRSRNFGCTPAGES